MRRFVPAALLALVLGGAAWFAMRDRIGEPVAGRPSAASSTATHAVPSSAGALDRGTTVPMAAARANRAVPPRTRTLFDDYLESRQYRALYDRLNGTPEGDSPKGRLVLYEVLRECATVTGGVPWPFAPRNRNTPSRDQFIAGIAPNDPARERRIAAYDQFTTDKCTGLANVSLSRDELLKLLRDSAAGGEPAARALVIEQDLWAARRTSVGNLNSISDAQVQALREAAGTRDPEAIRVAGRVLANGWHDYALRVGPEELPVEPRPFVNAWLVLACEYGAPCGADTPRMQQACAFQGYCDAQTYPDFLAYYGSTPHDSTLLMQYRNLVRAAIESGDWSQIRVVRGQPQASNRQTFIPGPR